MHGGVDDREGSTRIARLRANEEHTAKPDANAAKMAASFTAHPLVNTAWSLAVIGGDALRSRAFAALWGYCPHLLLICKQVLMRKIGAIWGDAH